MTDTHDGNTPLHWAILSKNASAISMLIRKMSHYQLSNAKGQTPFDIYMEINGNCKKGEGLWLPKGMLEKLAFNGDKSSDKKSQTKPLYRRFLDNKNVKLFFTMSNPFICFVSIGMIFQSSYDYLVKVGFFVLVYLYSNISAELVRDDRILTLLPISISLSTKFLMYFTWLYYIYPYFNPLTSLAYMLLSLTIWYNLIKTWRTDPGVIKLSDDEKYRAIIQIAEQQQQPPHDKSDDNPTLPQGFHHANFVRPA